MQLFFALFQKDFEVEQFNIRHQLKVRYSQDLSPGLSPPPHFGHETLANRSFFCAFFFYFCTRVKVIVHCSRLYICTIFTKKIYIFTFYPFLGVK